MAGRMNVVHHVYQPPAPVGPPQGDHSLGPPLTILIYILVLLMALTRVTELLTGAGERIRALEIAVEQYGEQDMFMERMRGANITLHIDRPVDEL